MNAAIGTHADMVWNNDGHSLWLSIEKSELKIVQITCPEHQHAACSSRNGCVVKWFVGLYGFECNIGTAAPEEHMEICWALIGDPDWIEEAQLWFVPTKDEVFYAWMESRFSGSPASNDD